MADFTVCSCHQCGAQFPVGRAHTTNDCIAYLKGREVELDGKLLAANIAKGSLAREAERGGGRITALRAALNTIATSGLTVLHYETIAADALAADDASQQELTTTERTADLAPLFTRAE